MASNKKAYLVYRGKKLALGCGVCKYADDQIVSLRTVCGRCLSRSKPGFILDKKYRDVAVQDVNDQTGGGEGDE